MTDIQSLCALTTLMTRNMLSLCKKGRFADIRTIAEAGTVTLDVERAFNISCLHGHMDIVQWIADTFPQISREYICIGFRNACIKGYLLIAQWLFDTFVKNYMGSDTYPCTIHVFVDSSIYGQLHVMQWLMTVFNKEYYSTASDRALQMACNQGHMHVISWLVDLYPDIDTSYAFKESCSHGHLHVSRWLIENTDVSSDLRCAFTNACKNGHLQTCRWLFDINLFKDISCELKFACMNGHIEVVKWLSSYQTTKKIYRESFELAIKCNHLDVVKYLFTIHLPLKKYHGAISCKHTRILMWLVDNLKYINVHAKNDRIFRYICRDATLPYIQNFLQSYPDTDVHTKNDSFFNYICDHNRVDIVKWFMKEYPVFDVDSAYVNSCEKGHTNIAKILYKHCTAHDTAFARACNHGHLNTVRWLLYVSPKINVQDGFEKACIQGHNQIINFLAAKNGAIVTSPLFRLACINNKLDTVKMMYNDALVINLDDACRSGNVQLVQWLHGVCQTCHATIDAFDQACLMGNLKMMAWLYDTFDTIKYDAALYKCFMISCENGYTNILYWISDLVTYGDISCCMVNKTGYIVASVPIDTTWQLIDTCHDHDIYLEPGCVPNICAIKLEISKRFHDYRRKTAR